MYTVVWLWCESTVRLLGVNLWKLQQRPNVGSMLLRLDFQKDVAPRLVFLKEIGVEDSQLGDLISHNPFILTESLDNLHARYMRNTELQRFDCWH